MPAAAYGLSARAGPDVATRIAIRARVTYFASGEIAVKSDLERYMTAHGKKDEYGRYSEYPAQKKRQSRGCVTPG